MSRLFQGVGIGVVAVGFLLLRFGRGIFSELDLILMLRASVLAPATIFSEYESLEASLLRVRHH